MEAEKAVDRAYTAIEDAIAAYFPGIVCWGDSLTVGAGGDGISYPDVLQSHVNQLLDSVHLEAALKDGELALVNGGYQYLLSEKKNKLPDSPVINMGVGGEDTVTICGRNGSIPFVVAEDFVIPEETKAVEMKIRSSNGKEVWPLGQGNAGMESINIGGIEGYITIKENAASASEQRYYYTRSKKGQETGIEAGTEIITHGSTHYLDYLTVIFIGTNGGYDDIAELMAQQKGMINHQEANRERFIIIGLSTGTAESMAELEHAMEDEYGRKYINLRDYMSTKALGDAGIIPTKEDLDMMAVGMTPESLLIDKVHFNATGYELIGDLIYERMLELGYFNEILRFCGDQGCAP